MSENGNFVLKSIHFVFKMMDFAPKCNRERRDFVFKMMDFVPKCNREWRDSRRAGLTQAHLTGIKNEEFCI